MNIIKAFYFGRHLFKTAPMACAGACGATPLSLPPITGTFFANTLAGQFRGGEFNKPAASASSAPPQPPPLMAAPPPAQLPDRYQQEPEPKTPPTTGNDPLPLLVGAGLVAPDELDPSEPYPPPNEQSTEQFHAFHANDLFSDVPGQQVAARGGDDVAVMSSYATGSGMKWTLPQIVDPEMAIDAGMHLLAKAFFYEDELALVVQLLRNHGGAPLPTAELKGADGAVIKTFKFDENFLKALLRRVSFGATVMDKLKPLIVFCLYCMTIRKFLYELQSYETLLAAAELDGGSKDPLGTKPLLPNLYATEEEKGYTRFSNPPRTIKEQAVYTDYAAYDLVQITRGLWDWSVAQETNITGIAPFLAVFTSSISTSKNPFFQSTGWVYDTSNAVKTAASASKSDDAKSIQTEMLKQISADAWFDTGKGSELNLVARLARAAWRSYFCDAIVRRFYQVAQRYSDFVEKHNKQAPGPLMADSDFLRTGGTAPNGVGRACPPGQVPTLEVPEEGVQRYVRAGGRDTRAPGFTGPIGPVSIEEARVPGTQMLKPGVEVSGCLPARQLTDVVAGTTMQALPVVDPFGKALAVPQNPGQPGQIGFSLFGGSTVGAPYQFNGNTLSFAAPVESMTGGVSASSPLIQQYFQHFHAPPFRAMMITPKL
jgi:hypothetical protein